MLAHQLIDQLENAGLTLTINHVGGLYVAPANRLNDELRALIRDNKPALVKWAADPDRHCWPHSSAMTAMEIETFAKRAALFNRRGLRSLEAEQVADAMVRRDREGDDRNACLECRGLSGGGAAYQCGPWRDAGLGGPVLARQLVVMLQRCNGFTPVADGKAKR